MRVTACSNRMNSSHFSVMDGPLEKLWGGGRNWLEENLWQENAAQRRV